MPEASKRHKDFEFVDHSKYSDQLRIIDEFWDTLSRQEEPIVTPSGIQVNKNSSRYQKFQVETGGTSGDPKRIRRTLESWVSSIQIIMKSITLGSTCYGVLGDLSHSLALYATIEAAVTGKTCVTVVGRSPREQAKILQTEKVDVLYATPTQIRLLSKVNAQIPTLQTVLIGGGRLDVETYRSISQLFPEASIFQFYGASETSFISIAGPDDDPASVGAAFPSVEIEVRNMNEQKIGEIWVKSPFLFESYTLGNSNDTQSENGWMTVGDLGRMSDDGLLYVIGRKSRSFKISDKIFYPEDLELQLLRNPEIVSVAVFPSDDLLRGVRVCCAVCSDTLSPSKLLPHLRTIKKSGVPISKWKVFSSHKWPSLPSGKANYKKLRQMETNDTWPRL